MLVLLFLCVSLSWGTVVESYCEYYTRYYWHHVPKTAILFILVFVFFFLFLENISPQRQQSALAPNRAMYGYTGAIGG